MSKWFAFRWWSTLQLTTNRLSHLQGRISFTHDDLSVVSVIHSADEKLSITSVWPTFYLNHWIYFQLVGVRGVRVIYRVTYMQF
jgi:hypothetical protein